MQEKLEQLRRHYESLPDFKIEEMLSEGRGALIDGAYDLLIAEAKKRGIFSQNNEEKRKVEEVEKTELEPVSSGRRFLNWIIDFFISMVFFVPCVFIFYRVLLVLIGYEAFKGFAQQMGKTGELFLFFFFTILYYFIFESTLQRTPAKFITRSKVVSIDGTKPTRKQILIRSLSRSVPYEGLSGLGGAKWIGWHDRWSQTMVVDSGYTATVDSKKL